MQFTEFIKYIPKIQKQQLPALAAHAKMAPAERIQAQSLNYYKANNPKQAAVMMLIYPKEGNAHIVLMKRNTYPGVHSAQISFPGGKAEPEDKSFADTALRETREEIGVVEKEVDLVMPFSELYIPPSNFIVYPYLGITVEEPLFVPDPIEVAEIIELPLETVLDDSIIIHKEMTTSYANNIMVPAFQTSGYVIWGATAMILSELKETIKNVL
ncbi:coenzyme A pyrophosphatase [Flavobacterium suaedae]|uniref:Coenzyme A pyrophosphatase n=1 Tax=Flavobacterium suaedae TaxID=1767027 RepID=A0ABQ1K3Z8_9FLAO|nr:CoA pyrophosphatase [Flavobacterium suaedae]GGB86954.1 coenzyme A pyrophosphatase [Flavobacterium suaedae]